MTGFFLFIAQIDIYLLLRGAAPIADFFSKRLNISNFFLARVFLGMGCVFMLAFAVTGTIAAMQLWPMWLFLPPLLIVNGYRLGRLRYCLRFKERNPPPPGYMRGTSESPIDRVCGTVIAALVSLPYTNIWDVAFVGMYLAPSIASYFIDVPPPPPFEKWFTLPSLSFGSSLPQGA